MRLVDSKTIEFVRPRVPHLRDGPRGLVHRSPGCPSAIGRASRVQPAFARGLSELIRPGRSRRSHAAGWRPPTLMKTPLLSQPRSGAAVSIWVEVRKVYSLASTASPRGQTGKHFGAAVAHSAGLNVEQVAAVRLQRVAQVGKRGAIRQQDLPVGAGPRQQRPVELGAGERSAGQGHNAPASLRGVAEIKWFSQSGLEAIDRAYARGGKLEGTRPAALPGRSDGAPAV